MKLTKIFLLIIAILAVGFLAGCEDDNVPEDSPDDATNEAIDLNIEYKNAALELLDESYCEKIDDATIKEECKTAVNDRKTMNEVSLRRDVSLCEQMSTENQQEACKLRFEVDAKKDENESLVLDEDEMATYTQAVKENKPELCETLQNPTIRDSCIASFVNKTYE